MNQQTVPPTAPPVTQKLPYAPPKATFVPLKLEERLLACGKVEAGGSGKCPGNNSIIYS